MNNYKEAHAPNHPNAMADGDIKEHRLVASKMLGRPLKPEEIVHHIDRNRRNNDPSNLMVFSTNSDHMAFHRGHKAIDNGDGTYHCEWMTKEEFISLLEKHRGYSLLKDIAEEVGVSAVTIGDWCRRFNIDISYYRIRITKEELINLLEKYRGKGILVSISKELDISPSAIINWTRKYNIDIKYYYDRITKEDLIKLLEKHRGTRVISNVADEMGVRYYTVSDLCTKFEINPYDYYVYIAKPSKEELISLFEKYRGNGVLTAITKNTGIDHHIISKWCKEYNIDYNDYSILLPKEKLLELLEKYRGKGVLTSIGNEIGMCSDTISDWCRKYGIDPSEYYSYFSKDGLLTSLSNNNYVMSYSAREKGISLVTISNLVHNKYNINIPNSNMLLDSIYKNNFNITNVAMDFNINNNIVLDLCHRYGIILGVYFE